MSNYRKLMFKRRKATDVKIEILIKCKKIFIPPIKSLFRIFVFCWKFQIPQQKQESKRAFGLGTGDSLTHRYLLSLQLASWFLKF